MKLILKDIPRLNSLYEGGEPDQLYDRRRLSKESDSYILQGNDVDVTSIENWKTNCKFINSDFMQTRSYIIDLFRWANNHSNTEIDIAIEMFIDDPTIDRNTNDTNKVTHLMGVHGMTLQESQGYLLECFANYHQYERESYKARRDSKALTMVVAKYLSFVDSRDFIETTKNLLDLYSDSGIVGVNYGVVGEGIIDYIDSTPGTSYEFAGLEAKGYTLNGGAPLSYLINEIKDVLLNGNY